MMRNGRVTLIARQSNKPDMDWNYIACRRTSVAFIQTVAAMRYALEVAFSDVDLDVGRVIVDRAGDADEFLELLATLPAEFTGDALYIRDNGSGVMSATARGGDRVLYSLTAHDIRFYLETHDLVTGRVAMGMTA
jgi:hypothetical protein